MANREMHVLTKSVVNIYDSIVIIVIYSLFNIYFIFFRFAAARAD